MNSAGIKTSYVLNYLTSKVSVVSMLSFLFLSKKFSKNLIVTLNFFLKESLIFIKKRVKFKGLGFRIKSISSKLWRFFFGLCVFFYLHSMAGITVYSRGRFLLLLSLSNVKLGNFLVDLKKLFRKKIKHYRKSSRLIDENEITFFYEKVLH